MPHKYNELEIWQRGYNLLMQIYEITSKYPKYELFALVQATNRSANSVIANIAEAHGRYYYADKVRVLYIARGEVEETQSHIRVAHGRNYIDKNTFQELDDEYEDENKGINNYISYLMKSKFS